ncbi:glycerate kinase type-2 family protein [Actibacterium lipolyticum]|uniref:Putative hydroxypyruvate reductase n=1 Tax=Actibacterium lipolyticum TaxID=1524263 RepID=A0A238KQC8_9RHOB|nr:glycerate kinase [Actibacterium lipolyticum]SMX44831.1 Putative hydroxypyruvate reductase [Actibacterium lipolyticum]
MGIDKNHNITLGIGAEKPADFLRNLFDRAVDAADPMLCVPAALPARPAGRVVVIGAGKASARMAEALESVWDNVEGVVITRYGYARPTRDIEILEAAHPVPDQAGRDATARLLALLDSLGPDDFVVALISGGGSALLIQPAGDITLEEKQQVNAALLASGAPISQMNTLRKHLSRVKGGQLAAAAYPAKMLALMISDIPGDDPAFIASGPTVGDDTTPDDARAILKRWNITPPQSVVDVLAQPTGVLRPDAEALSRVENRIVAAPAQSIAAAQDMAEQAGCHVKDLGDALEGEARDLAVQQAAQAVEISKTLKPGDAPVLLLSGGECTVTRRGDGVGGPNAEFCLSLAVALKGAPGIYALACDTDGVDGAAEVAGAIVSPDTLARAGQLGLDARAELDRNDSHGFFEKLGDQVVPGPTLTNVNDFRAILILPPSD